jgi:hypothetical protein
MNDGRRLGRVCRCGMLRSHMRRYWALAGVVWTLSAGGCSSGKALNAAGGADGGADLDAPAGSGGPGGNGPVDAGGTGGGAGGTGGAGGGGLDAASDSRLPDAGLDAASGEAGGHDDCRSDGDCPIIQCLVAPCPDSLCLMGSDGFHHCQTRPRPALQACPAPRSPACCRGDSDCNEAPRGRCVPHSYEYCGGPPPLPGNGCRYDHCTSDADCTDMPNGFCSGGSQRTCSYGPCRTNADCNRRPGGRCVLESVHSFCDFSAAFCRYANDPCRTDADCPQTGANGSACLPNKDLHGASCQDRPPPPP